MMTFFIQNNLKLQDWFERFDDVKCLIPNGGNLPISGVPLCLFFILVYLYPIKNIEQTRKMHVFHWNVHDRDRSRSE